MHLIIVIVIYYAVVRFLLTDEKFESYRKCIRKINTTVKHIF